MKYPTLEIHISINTTEMMLNMLHYFAESLKIFGGRYADSPIFVTVGEDQEPEDLSIKFPWSRLYNIIWKWTDRELFKEYNWCGNTMERYRHPFKSDVVLMLDADVLIVSPFDDLIQRVFINKYFTGIMGGWPPFRDPIES